MSEAHQSWALVSVRVKSPAAERHSALARRHQFEVGKPITFDREDSRVSGMEYLAAAVAADVIATLRRVARERRQQIDEIEAVAQGELNNALTFLGVVGEEGDPSLRSLELKVYLSTGVSQAEMQQTWDAALLRSPLVTTLRRAVNLDLNFQIAF